MLRIYNIPVCLEKSNDSLESIVSEFLKVPKRIIKTAKLYKKSIDARNRDNVHFIYCIDITSDNEKRIVNNSNNKKIEYVIPYVYINPKYKKLEKCPVLVGFGPAGIFAALMLARSGNMPIVIERGKDVDSRTKDVSKFWSYGELDENSNVQFGEGTGYAGGIISAAVDGIKCSESLLSLNRS